MTDRRPVRSRLRSGLPCLLLCCALKARAQQATPTPAPSPPETAAAPVPTLDRIQALRPDEEVLDLYTFKNPIAVDPNRFEKAYSTGISPEQMGRDPRDGGYGGYVNYGLNKGLWETWKVFKKATGMRPYEQPAIARPPPLTEEQMRRAAQGLEAGE